MPHRDSSFPAARLAPSARLAAAAALTTLAVVLMAACGSKDQAAGPPPNRPPPEVGVVEVSVAPVKLETELPGRIEALRTAQVRARVTGIVLKRLFREGSDVKAGQPLFQIDPAPYRASLDSAAATLTRAQATLIQAAAQADRYKPLVEANAISKQDYINATAAQKQAEADVAAGRASVQTAKLNLDYANVTAPIAGRIGRALVTEGALVSQTEATQLATIQQISSVYVNYTQSATDVLKIRRALASGQLRSAGQGVLAVQVVLEDGSVLPQTGRLLFSDIAVDPTSGQITLRAEVPNPDGLLLPGQYVRVRFAQTELPAAILVPQQAVTRSNQGDTVLVIGAENKPERRPVKIGQAQGHSWIVLDGLKPGEQVIADGFQKLSPAGGPVKPVPWQPGASAPMGAASAASGAPAAAGPVASAASGS